MFVKATYSATNIYILIWKTIKDLWRVDIQFTFVKECP